MTVVEPPDDRKRSTLDDWQRAVLVHVMSEWAARHPEPDTPFFGYSGGKLVSPRKLVREVQAESELGQRFLANLELVLAEVPFDTFVASIERSGRPRSRVLRFLLERVSALSYSRGRSLTTSL